MNAFAHMDLVSHVLGDADAELSRRIDEAAGADPILAAKLEYLRQAAQEERFLAAAPEPAPHQEAAEGAMSAAPVLTAIRKPRWRGWRRAAVAAGIAFALVGVIYGGYQLLKPGPLLWDDFNDGWLDSRLWRAGRRSVKEMDGHVQLLNRGSLRTMEEFREPIAIQFKWRFLDHGGDNLFAENLSVALRTSGRHAPGHPFEIQDGVRIELNGMGGAVKARVFGETEEQPLYSPDGMVPLAADAWHDVRVTDDGKTISVYLRGGSVPEGFWENPVLTYTPRHQPRGYHIAVFNRERLSDVVHESHLDDFRIDRLPGR